MTHPPWPYDLLQLDRLRADGWRPVPFRTFVLKIHQRCDLACDYCYVYELADQSWRDRPAVMAAPTWRAAAARIAEHARAHGLTEVSVVLHGGEPLLAGPDRLAAVLAHLRDTVGGATALRIGLQTNGMRLDRPMLDLLHGHGVRVGVSLDGAAGDHDRHRRRRDGTGSAARVHEALARLGSPRYRSSFAGLLCTVDPDSDPVRTYEALVEHGPPAVDFLLPHANWTHPPPRPPARYGDWLVAAFDRWYGAGPPETSVRLFQSAVDLVFGRPGRTEHIGLSPATVVVVETDGAVEQVDALKSAYPGAAATGRDVATHPFDDVLRHPGIVARQIGARALADSCRGCTLRAVCGGGHYAHRYRAGDGFRNPSVYCAGLDRFLTHVRTRVAGDLAAMRLTRGRA